MLTKEELLAVLNELERTKAIVVRVQKDFGDSLLISFSNYLEDTEAVSYTHLTLPTTMWV